MPRATLPFDPLSYLEGYMRLRVDLDPRGRIILHGLGRLEPRHAKRALWVRDTYDRLLRMQLDAPKREMRPSVRKLLAQGADCDQEQEICLALIISSLIPPWPHFSTILTILPSSPNRHFHTLMS